MKIYISLAITIYPERQNMFIIAFLCRSLMLPLLSSLYINHQHSNTYKNTGIKLCGVMEPNEYDENTKQWHA